MAPQRVVVGRLPERTALSAELAARAYRLVQITGEPGIGKTAMLTWLAGYAATQDVAVLTGTATDAPFGVLTAALTDHLCPGELRDHMSEERYRLASTVFPTLAPHTRVAPRDAERYRLHRALGSLLTAITPPGGLVLCLDDLHWADAATCDFLAHLVRQPPNAALLLVLSYRPRQLPARLADALRDTPSTRLALSPLSRAETAELAGVAADSGQAARLHEASGGNPLYAELLADQTTMDASPLDFLPSMDIPQSVASPLGRPQSVDLNPSIGKTVEARRPPTHPSTNDPIARHEPIDVRPSASEIGRASCRERV